MEMGIKVTEYTLIQWQLKFTAITIFILQINFHFAKFILLTLQQSEYLIVKQKDYTD